MHTIGDDGLQTAIDEMFPLSLIASKKPISVCYRHLDSFKQVKIIQP
jgi:hypothetical protein